MISISYIGKVSDVRGVCIELLNGKLSVELPVVVNVNVWNKDGSLTKDIKCVSIRRNSLNSRPRLISEDGKVIELSHCVEGGLVEEFRTLVKVLKEQFDAKQRAEYTKIVSKALGRDLISELEAAGVKFNKVSSVEETNVVRLTGMTKEDLNKLTFTELSSLVSVIKDVNKVLGTHAWIENIEDYHNLTPKDKATYHQFKFLQSGYESRNIHYFLRAMWDETSMYNCDFPLCQDLGYLSEQDVERLSEWLLINNYKKIGINQDSTTITNNIYHLVNAGWRLTSTTILSTEWKSDYQTLIFEHD